MNRKETGVDAGIDWQQLGDRGKRLKWHGGVTENAHVSHLAFLKHLLHVHFIYALCFLKSSYMYINFCRVMLYSVSYIVCLTC